jgi:hypothetical protein
MHALEEFQFCRLPASFVYSRSLVNLCLDYCSNSCGFVLFCYFLEQRSWRKKESLRGHQSRHYSVSCFSLIHFLKLNLRLQIGLGSCLITVSSVYFILYSSVLFFRIVVHKHSISSYTLLPYYREVHADMIVSVWIILFDNRKVRHDSALITLVDLLKEFPRFLWILFGLYLKP